jgi:hypothetical protein
MDITIHRAMTCSDPDLEMLHRMAALMAKALSLAHSRYRCSSRLEASGKSIRNFVILPLAFRECFVTQISWCSCWCTSHSETWDLETYLMPRGKRNDMGTQAPVTTWSRPRELGRDLLANIPLGTPLGHNPDSRSPTRESPFSRSGT